MVLAQHNQLLERQQLASQQIASASQQIEHFETGHRQYKRMIFGTKSEKLKGELEQLEFQLEGLGQSKQQRASASTTFSASDR